jgi:hypothetical protein
MRSHQEIDARSLELHRLIAAKVRREPVLLDRVRLTLQRWRDPGNPSRADPYLAEWERLMVQGLEPVLAAAISGDSEIVIIGAAALLGSVPSPPADLAQTRAPSGRRAPPFSLARPAPRASG